MCTAEVQRDTGECVCVMDLRGKELAIPSPQGETEKKKQISSAALVSHTNTRTRGTDRHTCKALMVFGPSFPVEHT